MLLNHIDRFVDWFLTDYRAYSAKPKFVHDPLWGTIEIRAHELCILDTPLLQRLRQIRQTGFVFATYPSAQHTRFEHTLGVMTIAGRMAQTLAKRYKRVATDETEQKVRLAALLHDVGHAAFSHTSEEVFALCEDMAPLLLVSAKYSDNRWGFCYGVGHGISQRSAT